MLSSGEYLIYGSALINDFLQKVKQDLIDYLDANNRNATGRSKASLQVVNLTEKSGQLIGSDSIEFVFRGRAPGKMPPLFAIIEWCQAKGIPRQAAWVIARRIADSGTELWRQGRDILSEVITPDKIDTLIKSLTDIYTAKIESDILNIYAKA